VLNPNSTNVRLIFITFY